MKAQQFIGKLRKDQKFFLSMMENYYLKANFFLIQFSYD
ncbi:hypothetical protein pb186bvf_005620 [Paramecium bursaria]